VFNGTVQRFLMSYGFHPGAAFPNVDAMHFDFIEGYGVIVGGGRAAPGTFSPHGHT
jgi:hypothetical protein